MPGDNAPTIKRHDTLASELITDEEIITATTREEKSVDKSAVSEVRVACYAQNRVHRSDLLMHRCLRKLCAAEHHRRGQRSDHQALRHARVRDDPMRGGDQGDVVR